MSGWRKRKIMNKRQEQMEKLDPLEVVKLMVEALDDAYAAGVRNSSKRPEWVGLTPDEKAALFEGTAPYYNEADYADAIEAKLKENNGYA